MSVYFIRNARTEAVKVGFSRRPQERLAALQALCEDELAIVGLIPTDDNMRTDHRIERRTHALLIEHGEHVKGEWFRGDMVNILAWTYSKGLESARLVLRLTDWLPANPEGAAEFRAALRRSIDGQSTEDQFSAEILDVFRRHPLPSRARIASPLRLIRVGT